jgi:hypothetical protein
MFDMGDIAGGTNGGKADDGASIIVTGGSAGPLGEKAVGWIGRQLLKVEVLPPR